MSRVIMPEYLTRGKKATTGRPTNDIHGLCMICECAQVRFLLQCFVIFRCRFTCIRQNEMECNECCIPFHYNEKMTHKCRSQGLDRVYYLEELLGTKDELHNLLQLLQFSARWAVYPRSRWHVWLLSSHPPSNLHLLYRRKTKMSMNKKCDLQYPV